MYVHHRTAQITGQFRLKFGIQLAIMAYASAKKGYFGNLISRVQTVLGSELDV